MRPLFSELAVSSLDALLVFDAWSHQNPERIAPPSGRERMTDLELLQEISSSTEEVSVLDSPFRIGGVWNIMPPTEIEEEYASPQEFVEEEARRFHRTLMDSVYAECGCGVVAGAFFGSEGVVWGVCYLIYESGYEQLSDTPS